MYFIPFEPAAFNLDREMPVEVMGDFDTVLLFGKLAAASLTELTVKRVRRDICFPLLEGDRVMLVRCYDTRMNPILLRGRVIHSSGTACTMGELERIPYKTGRVCVRYPLSPPIVVSILERAAPEQPCQLLNISASGACIVTRALYAAGQRLCLRVGLSKTDGCTPYPCRVLRATPRRSGWFEYGLLFMRLNRKQRDCLAAALEAIQDQLHICFGAQEGVPDE